MSLWFKNNTGFCASVFAAYGVCWVSRDNLSEQMECVTEEFL